MLDDAESPNDSVMLHLLDPATGHVMQAWLLSSQSVIKIGRDPSQDVLISHPHVSRQHAELCLRDGQWQVVSLGRNGILVDGQRVDASRIGNGHSFRLGAEGPTLRFFDAPPVQTNNSMTISSDHYGKLDLFLDETKVEQDVRAIAERDDFQQLRDRARELRRHRVK